MTSNDDGAPALDYLDMEALIIGGGPAGLVAATYLGRFRRRTILIDGGESRASWIPKTNNLIGFPSGISGTALLHRMRAQANEYGALLANGTVSHLTLTDYGFIAQTSVGEVRARKVLLATGGLDVEPEMPKVRQALQEGLVRYCPICDAFEARDKRIALIAYGKCRIKEALLLLEYTRHLTLLTAGQDMTLSEGDESLLRSRGAEILTDPVEEIAKLDEQIAVRVGDLRLRFDVMYSALGTRLRSSLVDSLGVEKDEDGAILTDSHLRTGIPGLFAAGDIVQGLSQIAVAAGHAAIAATTMNAELLAESLA